MEGKEIALTFGLAVLMCLSVAALFMINDKDVPSAEEIASLVEVPAVVIPELNESKLDEVHEELFKEDRIEEVALELALDELKDRDFEEGLAELLEDEISEVEDIDYKDIGRISVRDSDVDVDGEDAEVFVEFKVYFSNYGDEDEEERARVSVVFDVEDLDEDEDFEDASVEDFGDLELIRFYD